jgi:3-hydroxyisobutyrate dehydrogenase-like beta-hydroxyacid dehydrogenase
LIRPTVGLLAPGEMGHAVAAILQRRGVRVITNLAGRSEQTAARARKVQIEAVHNDTALARESDIFLSIAPPGEAAGIARRLAAVAAPRSNALVYVDCNAVSPATARDLGAIIAPAGLAYVDAGIIGPPPRKGESRTRIYASGPEAATFARLAEFGLDIRLVEGGIGAASAVKMCYAALTKGLMAIASQAFTTAQLLGVAEVLRAELATSRPWVLDEADKGLPKVPPKAYRWIAEMEEIGKTFAAAGFTHDLFEAVADVYREVGGMEPGTFKDADQYAAGLLAALTRRSTAAD